MSGSLERLLGIPSLPPKGRRQSHRSCSEAILVCRAQRGCHDMNMKARVFELELTPLAYRGLPASYPRAARGLTAQ